jgi:phosphoglucosamine mutase
LKKYFGTDGIRGIPNDTLSQDLISKISASVEQHINPKNIGVISDTRSSSDEILNWISIGFSSKVNIYNHGVLPSGSMPIILKKFNYDLGIIISASHNPAEYNGIKLIQENGSKLDDDVEISIEKNIDSLELPNQHAEIINLSDGHLEYLNFLDDVTDIDFSHFQILIDAANGSASNVIKELFDKKNANYRIINNQPDGLNINKDCGATVPENLQKNIEKGEIGASFDGDADRLIMVDENGDIVNGDLILTILSKYLSEVNQLTNNIVVSTVMSNYGFKQAIEKFNFDLIETPVGDKYVAEAMKKYDAALGGEQSGHIIISDQLPVGDGLVTLIYVLKAMQHFGVALSDFKKENLYEYPQKLTNLELENKLNDEELEYINQIALDMSIKKDLDGRYLIRNSGTEPLLRVLVEAKSNEAMEEFSNELITKINKYLN